MTSEKWWLLGLTAVMVIGVVRRLILNWADGISSMLRQADLFDAMDSAGNLLARKKWKAKLGDEEYARWEKRVAQWRAALKGKGQ